MHLTRLIARHPSYRSSQPLSHNQPSSRNASSTYPVSATNAKHVRPDWMTLPRGSRVTIGSMACRGRFVDHRACLWVVCTAILTRVAASNRHERTLARAAQLSRLESMFVMKNEGDGDYRKEGGVVGWVWGCCSASGRRQAGRKIAPSATAIVSTRTVIVWPKPIAPRGLSGFNS
jgi:hypothetical protein